MRTKSARPGGLCFSYEARCCTAPGPKRRAAADTWTHERERPLRFGGQQHAGGALCVMRGDQVAGADLLLSLLLLLLLCACGYLLSGNVRTVLY